MKKVLIFSVTAGNGHNAAAYAVQRRLEAGGATVKRVDLLKDCGRKFYAWLADDGYNLVSGTFLLPCYDAFVRAYTKLPPESRFNCPITNTVLSSVKEAYRIIREFQPDVIYGPHFYVAGLVTYLKISGLPFPPKTIISALDHCTTPFYNTGIGADKYVVPDDSLVAPAIASGYQPSQVEAWGVPIKEQFLQDYDKREARKELCLDPDRLTLLVMFGGGNARGVGKIFKHLVRALGNRPAQIIKINGRDKKSYRRTEKFRKFLPKNIRVLNVGFTDKVEVYFAASDLAVSKCGGLSTTEMTSMGLPFLVKEPLPEQEKYNLDYWRGLGVAKSFRTTKQLHRLVNDLVDQPETLAAMSDAARRTRRQSVVDISDWILSQPDAVYPSEPADYESVKKTVRNAVKAAHHETLRDLKQRRENK